MAIWKVKVLTKLPLEDLIGSLMTYEITMEKQELEEKPKKNLAFKIVHQVDDDDDEVEEHIALITRQFWNFLRKKQGNKKFLNLKKDEKKNLVRRHLDAINAIRHDLLRLIYLSFKTRRRIVITNEQWK